MAGNTDTEIDPSLAQIERDLARSLGRARTGGVLIPARPHRFAVEVSSYSLKALHLDRGHELRSHYFAVPRELHEDSAARARCLGDALRKILRAARVSRYLCVLPASRVRTAVVDLPTLSDDDCASALSLKALKLLSGNPALWRAHAQPLPRGNVQGESRSTYLLTVMEHQQVEELEAVFRRAAAIPSAVTTSCALYPGLMPEAEAAASEEEDELPVWVIMELNRYTTSIHIYRDRRLAYSRMVQFGGENLTRALMDVVATEEGFIELSLDEAEALKASVAIPRPRSTSRSPGRGCFRSTSG